MIYMKLLNLIQCSVTDVGCYICVDNSTLCNFMLHVCWIFCAWLIWLFCFVAIMPYFKLHAFNCEFQSLLSMPTIKEMEVSNIKLRLRWSKEIVQNKCVTVYIVFCLENMIRHQVVNSMYFMKACYSCRAVSMILSCQVNTAS